jgi:RHS repeat-associated protein
MITINLKYLCDRKGANRITEAEFSGTGQHNASYTYDKNGNIMGLTREGRFGESAVYGNIDELTYAYNGNQLQSVHDVNDPNHQNNGFTDDGSFATTEYQYDANGNMTQDLNKTLLLTRYNHLNLPQQIIIFEEFGNNILYLYDAAGRKLRKATRRDYNPTHTTDYVGSFVYVDDELQYLLTHEGRVVVDGSSYEYQYFLKDHLGNTRITFNESKQIIQEDSYYPYGMNMAGLSHSSGEDLPNKYRYNGKELQDDFGLDWYDYGARFYDAALGRWSVIDNKADKYYSITPYAYAVNNPILFIDPDGNEIKVYRQEGQNGANPTVVIQVTGKLVNNSSTSYTAEQMQGYAERLVSAISDTYSGTGENINYKAEVNITVASDDNKITDTDHTFTIQDQGKLPGSEGKNGVIGNAEKGKKDVNISQHILDRKEATTGTYEGTGKTDKGLGTLERTGAHELGHSATLSHPAAGTSDKNLMHQTKQSNAGKVVTETQVLQIEKAYEDDKLNK